LTCLLLFIIIYINSINPKENKQMTRKTKISCDVTREADNMLKAYCEKHERSKGYLIEKMIRKFCVEVEVAPATEVAVVEKQKAKAKRKAFKPPTVEEVREYCDSRCNDVDPQKFVSHYTANGWVRGKAETKIKCWKSCVQTWEGNNKAPIKATETLGGKW
jgi:hypothetical protein